MAAAAEAVPPSHVGSVGHDFSIPSGGATDDSPRQTDRAFSQPQERIMRNLTEQYLSMFRYESARFWAERLYYENPSEENLHLWANTYYRQGKTKQTYLMLKYSTHNHTCTYTYTHKYIRLQKCLHVRKFTHYVGVVRRQRTDISLLCAV